MNSNSSIPSEEYQCTKARCLNKISNLLVSLPKTSFIAVELVIAHNVLSVLAKTLSSLKHESYRVIPTW